MGRQTIAVDLDDVLAASAPAWVEFSNQRWGTKLRVDDYHEDWSIMWQVDRATEAKRAQEIYESTLIHNYLPQANAREVLEHLSQCYDLVIATSRVYKVHQDTLQWLNTYFANVFSDVHFSGIYDPITVAPLPVEGRHKLTKSRLIREIGADYLIDDQLKHCQAVAEAGIEALLFGDYAWNRAQRLPERVTRCPDWLAVKEYFDARS
jgi:5'(3')-deoxyribonucleotidase